MKIDAKQQRKLEEIGVKHALRFIVLHGSFATGRNHAKSDLDIAVLGQTSIDFEKLLVLHADFAKVFADLKNDLDIKSLHRTDSLFRYQVVRDSQLLYGDVTDYNEYKAAAFTAYFDSRELFRLEKRLIDRFQTYLNKQYA